MFEKIKSKMDPFNVSDPGDWRLVEKRAGKLKWIHAILAIAASCFAIDQFLSTGREEQLQITADVFAGLDEEMECKKNEED